MTDMEITIQQKVGGPGGIPRRNFKLKNGAYENAAYNDGGVPVHYIIVAWMRELPSPLPRSKEVQDYMDKFYPNNPGAIILGETNSDELDGGLGQTPREDENRFIYLQEIAIKLAEEKGLIPEYTELDIAECNYTVTLYGEEGK